MTNDTHPERSLATSPQAAAAVPAGMGAEIGRLARCLDQVAMHGVETEYASTMRHVSERLLALLVTPPPAPPLPAGEVTPQDSRDALEKWLDKNRLPQNHYIAAPAWHSAIEWYRAALAAPVVQEPDK